MNEVFEKARALGQAIVESEEFKTIRALEDEAMAMPEVAQQMTAYLEHKQGVETELAKEVPDHTALAAHSEQMKAAQEKLNAMDAVIRMGEARGVFSAMMSQVNQVLQFMVTGETEEAGCSGNCGSCGGCH